MTETGNQIAPQGADRKFWDRIGVPNSIKWGFLAVIIFMTGNAVESNFISVHMSKALGFSVENDKIPQFITLVITLYGVSVLIGSYLSGVLSDLWGPRRVMLLGALIWIVFEICFLLSMQASNVPLTAIFYLIRGFGYPVFSFAFLVWINHVTPIRQRSTSVGWFYVMFTGGLPTLGALFAILFIRVFGGGFVGENISMWLSIILVLIGSAIGIFAVREKHGMVRLAPKGESATRVFFGGIILTFTNYRVALGFLVRLINTAPQYGMFVMLPPIIGGFWGQEAWLLMTSITYASNIVFNVFFGWLGDRVGWAQTVRWAGCGGSAIGLLLWWYVPQVVHHDALGYVISVFASASFGIMLAGFVPMGAIMPQLDVRHKGSAMAMYTTAAGGAAFFGALVVTIFLPLGPVAVIWAYVVLYAIAFGMTYTLKFNKEES